MVLARKKMGRAPEPGSPVAPVVDSFDRPSEKKSAVGVLLRRLCPCENRNAILAWFAAEAQTSSFFAPINVLSRSANKLASNGFLNVSLIAERSKLIGFPSSGSNAISIVSVKSVFFRRF